MFGKFISDFMERAVVVKETGVFYKWEIGSKKFWIIVMSGTKSSSIINMRTLIHKWKGEYEEDELHCNIFFIYWMWQIFTNEELEVLM